DPWPCGFCVYFVLVCIFVFPSSCGSPNGAQCYGALGGSVSIQMMDDFSEIHRYKWFKKNTAVMSGRKDQQPDTMMNNKYSFIPSNGTFSINNLTKNDNDEYTLRTYDSTGTMTSTHSLKLSVQGKYVFIG
uniref:Immunoglobulin V-set domain-containing protein n=1 Tax=Oryzias melastigma TaxID=30732 RepID=A0A3B3BER8_ORYME